MQVSDADVGNRITLSVFCHGAELMTESFFVLDAAPGLRGIIGWAPAR